MSVIGESLGDFKVFFVFVYYKICAVDLVTQDAQDLLLPDFLRVMNQLTSTRC